MASLWSKLPPTAENTYKKILHFIEGISVSGENIFSREWDVCILIDACRYDIFSSIADNYDYIRAHESFISADSMTPRWMERTFISGVENELKRTAYVCGYPFGDEWINHSLLGHYEPVYEYAWDDEVGTVHPEPVTDAALRCWRNYNFDRLLIHYMQPHVPFVHWEKRTTLKRGNFSWEQPGREDTWHRLKKGEVTLNEVKNGYCQNLEYALDELITLVENIDSDQAVLTSDHGNGYGEHGIYGHPMHMPFQPLREVPWATIETKNTGEYEPAPKPAAKNQQERNQQLRALGYK
jgi:hypothetical protein